MAEITRRELLNLICPTDRTCDCKYVGTCDSCDYLLNYFLDSYEARVRAEVLGELREYCEKRYAEEKETKMISVYDFILDMIREFEQVKGA